MYSVLIWKNGRLTQCAKAAIMPYPHAYRLVVAGGERVGKTAIIEQLIFGNHVIGQGCLPTKADIYDIVVETEKGSRERLQIFDTSGSLFSSSGNGSEQEHYLQIADGFILVYEITSKASFDLIMEIRQKMSSRNKDVPMVILGNKLDCNAIREVKNDMVNIWARSNGIRPYEVTVGNRDCLKDPFCYLAWRMANPGRGISALPLLSTAGSTKPHPLVTPSSAEERGGAGHVTSKVDEPQDYASNTATSKNCPDDALYPAKRGPATLFLGDCLNVKNKDLPDTAGII